MTRSQGIAVAVATSALSYLFGSLAMENVISIEMWIALMAILFAAIFYFPKVTKQRKCPYCAEQIAIEAIVCKHCKSNVPQNIETNKPEDLRGLILISTGPYPIDVRLAIIKQTGMSKKESGKVVLGKLPAVITDKLPKEEAERVKEILEDAGAKVELRGFE
jgi:ribosomal protein L7/L12